MFARRVRVETVRDGMLLANRQQSNTTGLSQWCEGGLAYEHGAQSCSGQPIANAGVRHVLIVVRFGRAFSLPLQRFELPYLAMSTRCREEWSCGAVPVPSRATGADAPPPVGGHACVPLVPTCGLHVAWARRRRRMREQGAPRPVAGAAAAAAVDSWGSGFRVPGCERCLGALSEERVCLAGAVYRLAGGVALWLRTPLRVTKECIRFLLPADAQCTRDLALTCQPSSQLYNKVHRGRKLCTVFW